MSTRTERLRTTSAVGAALLWAALAAAPAPVAAQEGGAVERLRELVAVIGTPEPARLESWVTSTYAPDFLERFGAAGHAGYLARNAMSLRGAEVRGIAARSATEAVAELYNPLTEELDSAFVRVTAEAPHRITGLGIRPGAGGPAREVTARTDQERAEELGRYVERLASAGAFSGVVMLAKDGRPVFHEAYGVANRDFGVLNTRDTRFNLGSMNKLMTAVVIAQLVEEGKLAWTDPLSKFVPDFPSEAEAKRVTVEHLLTHTSGLGSYFNQKYFDSSRARWRTVDQMMELARPDSLRFEPGTQWAYSNTGYLVLGKVIEAVTGQDYFDVVRERLYEPVGMHGSGSFELDHVNPNLAVGYIREPGPDGPVYRNNIFEHVIRGGPAGGGYSTAPDLVRLAGALTDGTLVSRATLDRMRTPKPELASPDYGYGIIIDEDGTWGHGGGFPGIEADFSIYGDTGWTLVILANVTGSARAIHRRVTRLLEAGGQIAGR